jgi:FkbM family methyltransferase
LSTMKPEFLVRLSRVTRPVMRYRTPVIHRLLRLILNIVCPPAKKHNATHVVVPFDGGLINIDTSSSIEYDLLFRGCHEPEIVNLIKHTIRPGDVCLDLGANVGAHTLVMAHATGPTGRVIALEPHPQICDRLLQNVSLNRLSNVTVVAAALSDTNGSIDLYGFADDAFHQGISSLLPGQEAKLRIRARAVRGFTLQRECNIESCDFLKIDVEGAEGLVLAELGELISGHRPVIICEYRRHQWEKFGRSAGPVIDELKRLNYDIYYVRKNVTRPLTTGSPPDSCELFCVPRSRRDPN